MSEFLFLIEAKSKQKLVEFAKDLGPEIDSRLDSAGAVLLRGYDISGESELADVAKNLAITPLEYVYRSTPRTSVGGGVYTATEYPAGLNILIHNENAYQRDWPMRLLFFRAQKADVGGATTIADKHYGIKGQVIRLQIYV